MKLFKRMGQFFSVATIGVGIATLFVSLLWPVTVGLAVAALFSFGVYKYKKYSHERREAAAQQEGERIAAERLKKSKEYRKRKLNELKKEKDADITAFRKEMDADITAFRKEKDADIAAFRKEKDKQIAELTRRLDALESKAEPRRRRSFSFGAAFNVFKPQPLKRSSSFSEGFSTKDNNTAHRSVK